MLCYRDKTFCSASYNPCINKQCSRFLTKTDLALADDLGLSISFANFSKKCGTMIKQDDDAS